MADPTLWNLLTPVPERAKVRIFLAGEEGAYIVGYLDGDPQQTIEGVRRPIVDDTGRWEIELPSNERITPSGTVWRVVEFVDGKENDVFVTLEDDVEEHWLGDVLTDPPGALPSRPLQVEIERAEAAEVALGVRIDDEIADREAAITQEVINRNAAIAAAELGKYDARGNYDASTNLFPATGGSGPGGAVAQSDVWRISVAGTLGGTAVSVGDELVALVATPGQTAANWFVQSHALGYVPENVANKSNDPALASNSSSKYVTEHAAKGYTDAAVLQEVADRNTAIGTAIAQEVVDRDAAINAAVTGLWDDRGNYDASTNLFPATGGSGSAGAVKKGDLWTISVVGTLGGQAVSLGDTVRAKADAPGQTAGNWAIAEGNLGYTPENVTNKDIDGTLAANSDAKYPSQKAVKAFAGPPRLLQGTTLSSQGNSPYWLAYNAARTVLYVLVTNDRVVKAYTLSDEANPVLLGTSPTLGAAPAYLSVFGTTVFVTDQTDLTVKSIDASNPAAMTVSATLAYSSGGTGGGRCGVNDAGTYLLIGGPENGTNANKLALVDISTPGSPMLAGTSASIGATHRGVAFLSGTKWAVASRDDHTVRIIDTSTPATPAQAASFTTTQGNTTTPLKRVGSYLYVGNYGVGYLEKWDVSTPASPFIVASTAIAAGSEQIDATPDGTSILVGCRASGSIVMVDAATMAVLSTIAVTATVTPGVAATATHAYLTAAGDTTNGKLFVFTLPTTVSDALVATMARVAANELAKANLAGANTYTGLQTLTAALAIALTNDLAEIDFGTTTAPIPFKRTAAAAMRLDAQLRLLDLLLYPTGTTVARAFASALDSQPRWLQEIDGFRYGPGGSTASDVRFSRTGVNRASFLTTLLTVALGVSTMEINSTGLNSAAIDALWAATPPDGTIVSDPTNHLSLVRQGGTWYKTPLLRAEVGVAPLFVRKSADETVNNSAVAQADDELTLAVAANTTYQLELVLMYDSTTTEDLRAQFTAPAGATLEWAPFGPSASAGNNSNTTLNVQSRTLADTATLGGAGAGTSMVARITGVLVVGSTAGSLLFKWAQQTAAATNTVVRAGSFMALTKVS